MPVFARAAQTDVLGKPCWIKMGLWYRRGRRVNWNLFVQKCKLLKSVKINEKGKKKHYSSPASTARTYSLPHVNKCYRKSIPFFYISIYFMSVNPLTQQSQLHWALESTAILIIFANPPSRGDSNTPNLLMPAHRNMPRDVTNKQIGVQAAARQASAQLGAHSQKSIKTGLRSWISLFSQNFLFARKQPWILISKQWVHEKEVLIARKESAHFKSYC